MSDTFPLPDSAELAKLRQGLEILARYRLGDEEAAEEVAQESVERVLAALRAGRVNDPSRLGAFARSIALHVIADVQRARSRQEPLAATDQRHFVKAPDPLDALITREQDSRLRAALAVIPSRDSALLRLAYVEGLDSAELSARLGEPADRLRKRKQRAIERLRKVFLDPDGHDPAASATDKKPPCARPALEDTP